MKTFEITDRRARAIFLIGLAIVFGMIGVALLLPAPVGAQTIETVPLPPLPHVPHHHESSSLLNKPLNQDTFRETWSLKQVQDQQMAHGTVERDKECRLGDFLCNHAYYHRMYVLMELITGKSCCHNSEGRPTRDIDDLDPKVEKEAAQIKAGFKYKAWVDGQWCPAPETALLRISDQQKETFLSFKHANPELFYSFMEYDHAFAPKSQVVNGTKQCPTIYCLKKKDPQG